MICSVSFKLVAFRPIPGGCGARCHAGLARLVSQTFMESLILAQDERWRRA
jgi:hypothetical protein